MHFTEEHFENLIYCAKHKIKITICGYNLARQPFKTSGYILNQFKKDGSPVYLSETMLNLYVGQKECFIENEPVKLFTPYLTHCLPGSDKNNLIIDEIYALDLIIFKNRIIDPLLIDSHLTRVSKRNYNISSFSQSAKDFASLIGKPVIVDENHGVITAVSENVGKIKK